MNSRYLLVIEDDPNARRLVGLLLRGTDWRVEEAADAAQGLEKLQTQAFSCAMVDISMPGMSGDELCRRLRADPRFDGLYLIAFTGHVLRDAAEQMRQAGFDSVLFKPFRRADLLAALDGVPPASPPA